MYDIFVFLDRRVGRGVSATTSHLVKGWDPSSWAEDTPRTGSDLDLTTDGKGPSKTKILMYKDTLDEGPHETQTIIKLLFIHRLRNDSSTQTSLPS